MNSTILVKLDVKEIRAIITDIERRLGELIVAGNWPAARRAIVALAQLYPEADRPLFDLAIPKTTIVNTPDPEHDVCQIGPDVLWPPLRSFRARAHVRRVLQGTPMSNGDAGEGEA